MSQESTSEEKGETAVSCSFSNTKAVDLEWRFWGKLIPKLVLGPLPSSPVPPPATFFSQKSRRFSHLCFTIAGNSSVAPTDHGSFDSSIFFFLVNITNFTACFLMGIPLEKVGYFYCLSVCSFICWDKFIICSCILDYLQTHYITQAGLELAAIFPS